MSVAFTSNEGLVGDAVRLEGLELDHDVGPALDEEGLLPVGEALAVDAETAGVFQPNQLTGRLTRCTHVEP